MGVVVGEQFPPDLDFNQNPKIQKKLILEGSLIGWHQPKKERCTSTTSASEAKPQAYLT